MLDTRFESIEFLASEHIGAEMARNAGELRYFVVLSGQPAGPEFGHLPGHSPIFFDGQGGEKFPKALFGTQRSPVQIRAARLEKVHVSGGSGLRSYAFGGSRRRDRSVLARSWREWIRFLLRRRPFFALIHVDVRTLDRSLFRTTLSRMNAHGAAAMVPP